MTVSPLAGKPATREMLVVAQEIVNATLGAR